MRMKRAVTESTSGSSFRQISRNENPENARTYQASGLGTLVARSQRRRERADLLREHAVEPSSTCLRLIQGLDLIKLEPGCKVAHRRMERVGTCQALHRDGQRAERNLTQVPPTSGMEAY
jgi:hypothetical protein